ncbi:transcriptional regulator family: Fungal Specific TF [Penicillium bovifimosum]|uniref:Transcriptional regulator family: Fungal Specific TF n=1 Tax=Penicillium bovifimosum TaxID=126998 RepID=A0A9W9HBE1_9EURO|nr:transcriptional regulator family: Fungal Specific TF [Penicillium bovifimosum]KAJ5143542.1 transcriptional regulator family: Fungal Specific TF [Penicillium bovifimosum]
MSGISRARTGCWTCRARRIKCDETHPICRRCARNNVPCEYGVRLIWHEESLARGVCHGRAGVWSKAKDAGKKKKALEQADVENRLSLRPHARADQPWMFLNTTVIDLKIHLDGTQPDSNELKAFWEPGPSSSWLKVAPSDSPKSGWEPVLMSYFEDVICSSSTLVDNAHYNPYRYLILPMALQCQGLYHAALAIAANTLKLSDQKYRLPALEHHHRALSHLRGLLNKHSWEENELDEMLGLVLMLCWFDISDSSRPSWVTHLNGFQDLIRTRTERPGRSSHSHELASFFNRYFAFHLILARTAFRVTSPTSHRAYILPQSIIEGSDMIDPYMGLSPALLLLIDQIAELAWAREDDCMDTNRKVVYQLKENLDTLQQKVPTESIDPSMECAAIAEANRLGALLLLHEICSTKVLSPPGIPILDCEEKIVYVEQILGLLSEKKANMMRTAVMPLWPLFLAGCCANREEQRVVVLRLFEEVESIRRYGNIAPAVEVVEMVWRQRDLSAQDEIKRQKKNSTQRQKDSSQGPRFSWEHAMVMLGGWKLSLT